MHSFNFLPVLGPVFLFSNGVVFSDHVVRTNFDQLQQFQQQTLFSIWDQVPRTQPLPFLNDLFHQLSPFPKTEDDRRHCFTYASNFLGLDILSVPYYPIIIQKPVVALLYSEPDTSGGSAQFRWSVGGNRTDNHRQGWSFDYDCNHTCPFSTYLDSFCQIIKWREFSLNSKPNWECQLYVSLYPPNLLQQGSAVFNLTGRSVRVWNFLGLPHVFDEALGYKLELQTPPYLHALVVQNTGNHFGKDNLSQTYLVTYWVDSINIIMTNKFATHFASYFLIEVTSGGKSTSKIGLIRQLIPGPEITFVERSNLNMKHFESRNVIFGAIFESDGDTEVIRKKLAEHFRLCANVISGSGQELSNTNLHPITVLRERYPDSINDYVAHVTQHFTSSVLKNSSYLILIRSTLCRNGLRREVSDIDEAIKVVWYTLRSSLDVVSNSEALLTSVATKPRLWMEDPFNALSFVSCGKETVEPMKFQELFKVYDFPTWTAFLVTMTTGVIALNIFSELKISSQLGLVLFSSIFLEKSIQLRKEVVEKVSIRVLLGTFFSFGNRDQ